LPKNSRKKSKFAVTIIIILMLALSVIALIYAKKIVETRLYPLKYQSLVEAAAEKHSVEPSLIYAVIRSESSFNPNATSRANAKGLMQITDQTYDWLRRMRKEPTTENHSDLYDPSVSIEYGAYYLSYLCGEFKHWENALAAYNAGPTNAKKWLENESTAADGKLITENIPFPETRKYVQKVLDAKKIYELLYYKN